MINSIKGVTLVAMVITIIVMLILAGVTINIIINGGIFDQAKKGTNITAKEAMKEKVNIMIEEYIVEKNIEGKAFIEFFEKKKQEEEIKEVYENIEGNYVIEKDGYEIIIKKETLLIEQIEEIKEPMPREELATTPIQFSKSNGIIEVVWINTSNKVIGTPMPPELGGLTPIKWEGTVEKIIKADDPDWYMYEAQKGTTKQGGTSKWANAKAVKGTNEAYFVW